ncbi:hypothetical protein [Mesorhizobium sp. RMAD-H1]|uniref:hypothetical protein n=1 Tax=Mesorhizobium sp. RMAD-H1 TaxID=2587065 RepID=UPI00161D1233|nr:hypothetical protein [Mesorhizobium sp. RMAD-H1]MBB2973963.1 hypothetical protein [Mesorhizobium sp. RMAD-H1]
MNIQPFLFGDGWIEVRDGNDTGRALFDRHYSRYRYADGRKPKLYVGPGEKMVLLTGCAQALFVWRKFKTMDRQAGVNCAIFRNEGAGLSSELISAADHLADQRWAGVRHYTYVNPFKIRGSNPGCCFKRAGWRFCGLTKRGLHILERTGPEVRQ